MRHSPLFVSREINFTATGTTRYAPGCREPSEIQNWKSYFASAPKPCPGHAGRDRAAELTPTLTPEPPHQPSFLTRGASAWPNSEPLSQSRKSRPPVAEGIGRHDRNR